MYQVQVGAFDILINTAKDPNFTNQGSTSLMQVENYLQDPSRFNLNDFRKNIKWVDGKIDLNDLWA